MKKLILILSFLSLGVGCVSSHQDSNSDEVLVGYRLIDQGRADEAIDHFQSLQQKNGNNIEYRRGLSSAYALRGGFKVQSLIRPMKEMKEADSIKDDLEALVQKLQENNSALSGLKNLILTQIKLVIFLKKFESIPTPTVEQAADLKMSISILQGMEAPDQGDYLYMAVLQTLILKSKVDRDSRVAIDNCNDMVRIYQKIFLSIYGDYGKIISFLIHATPSRSSDYEKQLLQIDQLALETSGLTGSSLQALLLIENVKDSEGTHIFSEPPRCRQ